MKDPKLDTNDSIFNKNSSWDNIFNFPIVKNVFAKLISDDLESVKPMSIEEIAAGRPIKPYPFKYDSFASSEDLKNYIKDILFNDKTLKAEWLEITSSIHSPWQLRDDVYYDSIRVISINCHRPPEHSMDDIIYGTTICELQPNDSLVLEAQTIIDEIKKNI